MARTGSDSARTGSDSLNSTKGVNLVPFFEANYTIVVASSSESGSSVFLKRCSEYCVVTRSGSESLSHTFLRV